MTIYVHRALGDSKGIETPYADSRWVVMKFGGTSVATAANWGRIERLLRDRLEEGVVPFVCHSAVAGISNLLVRTIERAVTGVSTDEELARFRAVHETLAASLDVPFEILKDLLETLEQLVAGIRLVGEASPRVHARVMAAGELAATLLGAAYLRSRGLEVDWHDATKLLKAVERPEQTERVAFLAAHCSYEPDPDLIAKFAETEHVVLTQGFIASNSGGDTVLLGRGGSDTSGAYFAAKLKARRLEIWTDVPGFFSADPRAVPSARLIRHLHYSEAQEIASAGGGVLHPRSISPVRRSGIPLFLKCTTQPDWEGSVISGAADDDGPMLKAISHRTGITLISMESFEMWHQVGFLASAFECFRRHGISVDLISTAESNVTVTIDMVANVTSRDAIAALVDDLKALCRVEIIEDCAAITLVGRRIRATLPELAPMLQVFEEHRVHLVTQAANDLNLTFVLGAEHAHRLVKSIHAKLVGRLRGDIFGPTWAELEGQQVGRPERTPPWWLRRRAELIALMTRHESAYVYDRATIAHAVEQLMGLRHVDRVFYAMKANSNPDVLRAIHEGGISFECVSPGEIQRVRDTLPDVGADRILFTPNFAPRREYEWALAQGVWLTLDSLYPLQQWGELFRGANVLIRVDTGKGRGHHEHVKTAGVHSKFGIPLFELDELIERVAACGVRVIGLHAHAGSGVLNPSAWRETGQQLAGLMSLFPDLRLLDLGGGLGVPEKPGEAPLDMAALDEGLASVKAECPNLELWLEPGRFLVAQAGVLLTRVTQKKGKGRLQYIGTATGMNSLIRPALYGAYHEIVNLSKIAEPATELTTVVGPICETADQLGTDRLMPRADEGDVLAIANAGAYGFVMSSRYNLREPATEIVI